MDPDSIDGSSATAEAAKHLCACGKKAKAEVELEQKRDHLFYATRLFQKYTTAVQRSFTFRGNVDDSKEAFFPSFDED